MLKNCLRGEVVAVRDLELGPEHSKVFCPAFADGIARAAFDFVFEFRETLLNIAGDELNKAARLENRCPEVKPMKVLTK